MIIRDLERNEIETIWTIDRSEVHHNIYQMRGDQLVLIPAYFETYGWAPGQIERDTPALYACFERGGAFVGMFDDQQLIGVAVLDNVPLGPAGDQLQLKYLYVSREYRRKGVGTRLFQKAVAIARARGAAWLYISATPTENTIHFYERRGAVVNLSPEPELYAQEPDDIHMLCPIE
jgi:GNAT superfamily N-acetyltransferase